MKFWLWPNRVIGKRCSGELREEHNKAVQQIHDLRKVLAEANERIKALSPEGYIAPERWQIEAAIEATKEES